MQLPDSFSAFHLPTFVVISDHRQAKLYRVHDRTVELMGEIITHHLPLEKENSTIFVPGGMHAGNPKENLKEVEEEELIHALNDDLMRRLHQREFERLLFTVPEDGMKPFKEKLHPDLLSRTDLFLPKLLISQDLMDAFRLVEDARHPA